MKRVTLDLETFLTAPAFAAPLPVCAVTFDGELRLWPTWELERAARLALAHEVVGHNLAFDMAVLAEWFPHLRPLIWAAYEEGRILDTMAAQIIINIQRGRKTRLGLEPVAQLNGFKMEGKDKDLAKSFGQYYNRPMSELSPEHRQYLTGDGELPQRILERQLATGLVSRRDLAWLTRTMFWLHLVSASGFRADPAKVDEVAEQLDAQLKVLSDLAKSVGFMRPNGVRNMKAIKQAIVNAYGEEFAPHVDGDPRKGITTAYEALADSGDEDLIQLASMAQLLAIRSKDIPMLRAAASYPLHTRFGINDTLRASSSNPNQQNMGKFGGVRECIIPRDGCFVLSDFGNLENVGLAQLIIWTMGRHEMANMLNNGIDLHAKIGAFILGISYDEVKRRRKLEQLVDDARNAGKPANYGLAGGMKKPETFQRYARGSYNVCMDLPTTIRVMDAWQNTMHDQVAWVEQQYAQDSVQLPGTDMILYHVGPTQRCNYPFQSIGMRVASNAGWRLTKAQYLTGELPGRVSLFIHDEFGTDCLPEAATEVARIQERCMIEAAAEELPDMKMQVDTKALDRYSKNGEAKWEDGRLMVVTPPQKVIKRCSMVA